MLTSWPSQRQYIPFWNTLCTPEVRNADGWMDWLEAGPCGRSWSTRISFVIWSVKPHLTVAYRKESLRVYKTRSAFTNSRHLWRWQLKVEFKEQQQDWSFYTDFKHDHQGKRTCEVSRYFRGTEIIVTKSLLTMLRLDVGHWVVEFNPWDRHWIRIH